MFDPLAPVERASSSRCCLNYFISKLRKKSKTPPSRSSPLCYVAVTINTHSPDRLKRPARRDSAKPISDSRIAQLRMYSLRGLSFHMQHLAAEAERARRLAETSHDSELTRELTAYAAELERVLAYHRLDQSDDRFIDL